MYTYKTEEILQINYFQARKYFFINLIMELLWLYVVYMWTYIQQMVAMLYLIKVSLFVSLLCADSLLQTQRCIW